MAPEPATGDAEYYKSEYTYDVSGEQQLADDQYALGKRIVNEGVVLLKSENNALPMSPLDGKVMVFGNAGANYMYGLDQAFTDAGFTFDQPARDFYTNGSQDVIGWQVNENPWSNAVDALVWFGNIAKNSISQPLAFGSEGFVEVLDGTANPSGRLVARGHAEQGGDATF